MYEYRLVVQYSNGELEGFADSALTEADARKRAERKALDKIEFLMDMGKTGRFLNVTEYENLSDDKKLQIKADWDLSLRSQIS